MPVAFPIQLLARRSAESSDGQLIIWIVIAVVAILGGIGKVLSDAAAKQRQEKEREAWHKQREEQKLRRYQVLMAKYHDAAIVARLLENSVWVGQTEDQLLDSLGPAIETEEKVLKTKVRYVWKYQQTGQNRFALRVTLENGEVTGWDQK